MKIIKTETTTHKGEKRIKLLFEYDTTIVQTIKKIRGARWSQTMKCWHMPDDHQLLNELSQYLPDGAGIKGPDPTFLPVKHTVDNEKLRVVIKIDRYHDSVYISFPGKFKKAWIEKIKAIRGRWYEPTTKQWSIKNIEDSLPIIKSLFEMEGCIILIEEASRLPKEFNKVSLKLLVKLCPAEFSLELKRRNYCEKTILSYCNHINYFLYNFSGKDIAELSEIEIMEYLANRQQGINFHTVHRTSV